jgi:hypothetical protein
MTILKARALLLAGALSLASCNGDETPMGSDSPEGNGQTATEVTAVIDGEPFSASLVTITAVDDSLGSAESLESADLINVIASGFPDDRRYVFVILHDMRTGEHDAGENLELGFGTPESGYSYTTNWGDDVAGGGSLDLDVLSDDRIAGSFAFEAYYRDGTQTPAEADRVVVTDGRFDIAIQGSVPVQPAGRRASPKR